MILETRLACIASIEPLKASEVVYLGQLTRYFAGTRVQGSKPYTMEPSSWFGRQTSMHSDTRLARMAKLDF
jgi:hypothetical protein